MTALGLLNMNSDQEKATSSASTYEQGLLRSIGFMARAGLICVIIGAGLQLFLEGNLEANVALFDLPRGLMNLEPAALVSVGIGCFILGPAIGLVYLLTALVKDREPQAAIFAAGVLVIMALSLIVKLVLSGGAL